MAKVILVFTDIGNEGDAEVKYEGDPDFDIYGDPLSLTTAQLMAKKVADYLASLVNEDSNSVPANTTIQ